MNPLKIKGPKGAVKFFLLPFVAICLALFICAGCEKKTGDLNVLLITVDGMRSDTVGPRIKKGAEMPVLDGLWKNGTVFPNTIVTSPFRTPSYSSIFSGLYPSKHGVRSSVADFLPEEIAIFPELLQNGGYRTGAVVSNAQAESITGLSQGFNYYQDDMIAAPVSVGIPWGRRVPNADAKDVTDKAIGWLEEARHVSKPWFLWTQYSDLLPARDIPTPFREMFSSKSYGGALTYVDTNIGLIMGKLDDWDIRKRTLVIITSSHGLTLAEHEESGVSSYNYISSIRVPVVVNLPGKIPSGRELPGVISAVDLMPTILGFANLKIPEKIDGRDLSEKILKKKKVENTTAYTENLFLKNRYNWHPAYSLVSNNYHLIEHGKTELYDIREDPGEENNLADTNPDKVKMLKEQLQRFISAPSPPSRKIETETVERKLKLLGILENEKEYNFSMTSLSKDEIRTLRNEIISARRARSKGEHLKALDKYTEILDKYPTLPLAKYELGLIYMNIGKREKAKEQLKKAASADWKSLKAAALIMLAQIFSAQNKLVEAENLLEPAVKIVPKNPAVQTELGNIYAAQGLDSEAERQFRKALELEPRYYRAHFALASLYITDPRRATAALQQLEKVFKYNPDFAPARIMAARIVFRAFKNPDEARMHLEKALNSRPSGPIAERAQQLLEEIENYNPDKKP